MGFQDTDAFRTFKKTAETFDKTLEVQPPDSFASTEYDIHFIFGLNYGLPTDNPKNRPMALGVDKTFCRPSLHAMMHEWIFMLCFNGHDYDVARCLIYSSVLVVTLCPIAGGMHWGGNACNKTIEFTYKQARQETKAVKSLLDHILRKCKNVIAFFAAGLAAYDGFPDLLAGTYREGITNQQAVVHPSVIYRGFCTKESREKIIIEFAKCLRVAGARIDIDKCMAEKRLIHVSALRNKALVEEDVDTDVVDENDASNNDDCDIEWAELDEWEWGDKIVTFILSFSEKNKRGGGPGL